LNPINKISSNLGTEAIKDKDLAQNLQSELSRAKFSKTLSDEEDEKLSNLFESREFIESHTASIKDQ
jgi:hypothetical protein